MADIIVSANVDAILQSANYAAIKALLSLNNLDNTSDANKPVSSATQTALNLKANLSGSNTFAGSTIFSDSISLSNGLLLSPSTGVFVVRCGSTWNDGATIEFQNGSTIMGSMSPSGFLWNLRGTFSSLVVGSGTAVTKVLSATATLDFGSIAANSYADLTITITGAAVGDTVSVGFPNGSITDDLVFSAWVSATNTVTIRCANNSSTTARDPASGTFRATVTQF